MSSCFMNVIIWTFMFVCVRVRESQVLFLAGKTKGCFYAPPYLDDYGETDQGLRYYKHTQCLSFNCFYFKHTVKCCALSLLDGETLYICAKSVTERYRNCGVSTASQRRSATLKRPIRLWWALTGNTCEVMWHFFSLKAIVYPKIKNVIIYSPSCLRMIYGTWGEI